jgi:beta-alanine--pyruvate transaminase
MNTSKPASMSSFWMPFTNNRDFKAQPRLLVSAKGMYYRDVDGKEGARRHRRPVVRALRPRPAEDRRRDRRNGRPARLRAHLPDGPPGRLRAGRAADGLHEPQVRPGVLYQLRFGSGRYRAEDRAGLPQGARRGRTHPPDRARARLPRGRLRRPVGGRHRQQPQAFGPLLPGVDHLPHTHNLAKNAYSRGEPDTAPNWPTSWNASSRCTTPRPSPPSSSNRCRDRPACWCRPRAT